MMRNCYPLLFLLYLGANACDVFQMQTALYIHFDDKSDETGWELSCDDGLQYWNVPPGSLSEAPGSWASYTACIDDTAMCYFQLTGTGDLASTESRPGSHFNLRYGELSIQKGRLPQGLVTICIGLGCDQASYPTKAPRAAPMGIPTTKVPTPAPTPVTPTFGPEMEQVPTEDSTVSRDAVSSPAETPTPNVPTPAPTPVTPTFGPHMEQEVPTTGSTVSGNAIPPPPGTPTTKDLTPGPTPVTPTFGPHMEQVPTKDSSVSGDAVPPSPGTSTTKAPTPAPTPVTPTFGPHMEQVPTKSPTVSRSTPVSRLPQEPSMGVTAAPVSSAPSSGAPVSDIPVAAPVAKATMRPSTQFTSNQLPPSAVFFTRSPVATPTVSSAPVSTAPVSAASDSGAVSLAPTTKSFRDDTNEHSSNDAVVAVDFTATPNPATTPKDVITTGDATKFGPTSDLAPPTSSPSLSDASPQSSSTQSPVTGAPPAEVTSSSIAPASAAPVSVGTSPSSEPRAQTTDNTVSSATDGEKDGVDGTTKFWRRRLTYIVLGVLALCLQCLFLARCLCIRSRRRKALQQRDRLDFEESAARASHDIEEQRTWSPRTSPRVYNTR